MAVATEVVAAMEGTEEATSSMPTLVPNKLDSVQHWATTSILMEVQGLLS